MLFPIAAALVLAQTVSFATGRPPECADPGGRSANVWERARRPELRRYCDLVASASSKLAGTTAMAESALASAREANEILPGYAAPLVLEGRALAALGKLEEARKALAAARALDASALEDPLALLAWARVAARTGHTDEAEGAYRALLPRASAISASERAAASVEAGLVSMARATTGLDDAVAALREGLREAQDETQTVAVLGLALALDRRGDKEESRALLAERAHGDPRAGLASPRAKDLLAVAPAETNAMIAIALQATDPAGAHDAWERYLAASPAGPWAAHARAHLDPVANSRQRTR